MSLRQEALKAEMWIKVHKASFDKRAEELRAIKAEIEKLPLNSEERRVKQRAYDDGYAAAEEFFNKFYEPSVGA